MLNKTLTIEEKRKESSLQHPFIRHFNSNIKDIARVIHIACVNTPQFFNNLDYRPMKSLLIDYALTEHNDFRYLNFKRIENQHYDVLVNKKYQVSIKTQRKVFERLKDNTSYFDDFTKPAEIVVKNCFNKRGSIDNDQWDYLLAIQPQDSANNINLSFGIATFKTIQDNIIPQTTEQIKVKISNNIWDYYYKCSTFFKEYTDLEKKTLNTNQKKLMEKFYGNLLKNNLITLNNLDK